MKISIITPSFNSAKTIQRSIDSIKSQDWSNREHVIIDGASRDTTVEIIKNYAAAEAAGRVRYVSEPDHGIYDAMNKGVSMADGEIIGILNSDDRYKDTSVLSAVAAAFQADPDLDAVYGDLEFSSPTDQKKIVRLWRSGEYQEKKLANGWIMPHPTVFLRRRVYQKLGLFRTDMELAGDYEFLLRALKAGHIKTAYLPRVFVTMQAGGASGRNLKQRRKGWRELERAWEINNFPLPRFFILRRILSKLGQYL